MPWLELNLTTPAEHRAATEAALEELGALSVTLRDADVDTPDERAIFEPGVGETPMWQRVILDALFDADQQPAHLAETLARQLDWLQPNAIRFREVADQDWERVWMDRFQPMAFGERLWVYPWNVAVDGADDKVVVRLDPGLAFGTGTHPTTAMCLAWLDGTELVGKTLIDYGCGSGVLAIAALKLGAARVIGIDNDPQALTASRDNAERNGVAERLAVYLPEDAPNAPADVLVANILAGPLGELAPRLAGLCKPGAPLALSGILAAQAPALQKRYAAWFTGLQSSEQEGWLRLAGIRNTAKTQPPQSQ